MIKDQQKVDMTIQVMLSDDCCLPCHTFEKNRLERTILSLPDLHKLFSWASTIEHNVPDLYFLAGATSSLDPEIASLLGDMADHVVTPLTDIEEQKSLRIPFSESQTVIANSLRELMKYADHIVGRPCVVHLEKEEIKHMAVNMFSVREYIGSLTLRLKNLHHLNNSDFLLYEKQLTEVMYNSLLREGTIHRGNLNLHNLGQTNTFSNGRFQCCEDTKIFAFGPDGRFYPCPAFFLSGISHFGVTFDEMKSMNGMEIAAKCKPYGSSSYPGCCFLESVYNTSNCISLLFETEQRASQQTLHQIAHSSYHFDNLRTLKTTSCILKSQKESKETAFADLQIFCIKLDEFERALRDIYLATQLLITNDPGTPGRYKEIIIRWSELSKIPPSSQRAIFRRRTREILEELLDLKNFIARNRDSIVTYSPENNTSTILSSFPLQPQKITKTELDRISELHRRRLGWLYLLNSTIKDRKVRFPCVEEEETIRRQLKYTCHQIAKWFEITQTKRNWPSIDGYVWEVDFKKCIVFPRHNSSLQKQKSSVIGLAEGPIMEISEIDTDIIQRLFAKRGAMADLVRSKLNGLANEENKENKKLNIWVSQLGEACQDINEWFSEMSIIHNWPKINSQWQYRASFSENKVYLEHV